MPRIIGAVIAIILSAWLGFMAGDRQIPFVRNFGEIIPINPVPGGEIGVIWYGHRVRDCPGTVHRRIIDSHGVEFTLAPVGALRDMPPGYGEPMKRTFHLPLGASPGPAEYVADAYFVCNFLQNWWPLSETTPHIKFNIAPSP